MYAFCAVWSVVHVVQALCGWPGELLFDRICMVSQVLLTYVTGGAGCGDREKVRD